MENLMKNKKGFLAKDWIIATIFFGGIVALAILMVGAYTDTYNSSGVVDQQFSENYDHLQDTSDIASQMQESVRGKGGVTLAVAAELVFSSTFTVIGLIWDSLTLPVTVLSHFAADFDIPSSVTFVLGAVLTMALIVVILFAIIGSLKKGDL